MSAVLLNQEWYETYFKDFYYLGVTSVSSDSHIDWDEMLRGELEACSKLHHSSFPLKVDLPSIEAERAANCTSTPSALVHRQLPFQSAAPNMTALVHCASPATAVSTNCILPVSG